jgi:hypothetical protein
LWLGGPGLPLSDCSAWQAVERRSRGQARVQVPIRSTIVMVIKPERVRLQDLEAVPKTS